MQLYLGLDPTHFPNALHYPVIRTEKILSPALQHALSHSSQFTHFIFTSKSCVRYWLEASSSPLNGVIAIGVETAGELRKNGVEALVAPAATQEGVIDLLNTLDLQNAFIFYPHSKRARPCLVEYLQSRNIYFLSLDLYDTILQKPEPVPSLDLIDEIIFTSPSTVDGFLQVFKEIPKDKKLTCIGPVTYDHLDTHLTQTRSPQGCFKASKIQ